MTLDTMRPNPDWNPDAYGEVIGTFAGFADEITVRVWGADWCGDCQRVLPDFAAVLDASGVSAEAIHQYETEKLDDGSKVGPFVDEYDVEYIPTIVIEREGEEVARFVEEEPVPAAVFLANRLDDLEASA